MESLPFRNLHPRLLELVRDEFGFAPLHPRKPWDSTIPVAEREMLDLEQMCEGAAQLCLEMLRSERPKIALALALTFLRINGIEIRCQEVALFQSLLELAYGESSAKEFGDFLFRHGYCKGPETKWRHANENTMSV